VKIIGLDGNGNYVAVVDHSELEKVVNKYYGNLPRLKAGDDFPLGSGYDFKAGIQSVCEQMQRSMEAFERNAKTLSNFAAMVAELPEPAPEDTRTAGESDR